MAEQAKKTASEWGEEYQRQQAIYRAYTEKLRGLMCDLLAEHDLEVALVEARAKAVESFVRKIQTKGEKYEEPLQQVTDLAGVRVITYYLEDVEQVGAILAREFEIDTENSVAKAGEFDPDRFGYLSDHHVLSVCSPRAELPEWRPFAGFKVEVQVRTVTQHAWAAIEHKLRYKSAREAPDNLKRRLSRLSALFELADDQFSALRIAARELEDRYAASVEQGDLDVPLDASSLLAYLAESATAATALEMLVRHGFSVRQDEEDEEDRERHEMDRSDLLAALSWAQVGTLKEFENTLVAGLSKDAGVAQLAAGYRDAGYEGPHFAEDLLTLLVFLVSKPPEEVLRDSSYSERAVMALLAAYDAE